MKSFAFDVHGTLIDTHAVIVLKELSQQQQVRCFAKNSRKEAVQQLLEHSGLASYTVCT